jgi:hypothetical protein
MALAAPGMAFSTSASAKTIIGGRAELERDLFQVAAAALTISLPTSVDP